MKFLPWTLLIVMLGCAGWLWAGAGKTTVQVREYKAVVEESLHHDPSAYTQGLFFMDGVLYESVGQYGESALRKIDFPSGRVLNNIPLERHYFGEGACCYDGRIYQLTWMEQVCFVYDATSLSLIGQLYFPTEGWGLTTDGQNLIMSDGSSTLYFLDPNTFQEIKKMTVRKSGKEVPYLNELEYIQGKIWANVYGSNYLVIIDPETGVVTGTVDCRNLLPARYADGVDVLNGIAYDPNTDAVYVTGKLWPQMYRISLTEKQR